MTTALVIAVVVAALVCPAHMLWRMRQGRRGCCGEALGADAPVEALQRRQRTLRSAIDRLDADPGASGPRS